MRRLWAALSLVVAVLTVLPGGMAAAAPGSAPHAAFGVRPTGNRPTFAYAATPGGVFQDSVEVSNPGTAPLTLRVYASDAFNPRGGGFDLLAAGRKSTDVGSWIEMSRTSVQVPARGAVTVGFTLHVPAGATPGDHTGGIVASLGSVRADANGNRVTLDQRVGARIYLRVSGTLQPGLTVEGLSASFHPSINPFGPGRTTLTWRVRNTGNVRLGARQQVTVDTLWGAEHPAPAMADLPDLLPGNSVEVSTEIRAWLPAVWLTGAVRTQPLVGPGDQSLTVLPTTREQGFWAISWTLAALVVSVAALVVLAWRYLRRRRTRRPVVPLQQLPEPAHATA